MSWFQQRQKNKPHRHFFCQLLRITLPGKIRSDRSKSNHFLGMPELVWPPLCVFKTPGFCDPGGSLGGRSGVVPARGRRGTRAGRGSGPGALRPPRAGSGLGCCGQTLCPSRTAAPKRKVGVCTCVLQWTNGARHEFRELKETAFRKLARRLRLPVVWVRARGLLKCCHEKPGKCYILLQTPSVRIRRLLL